MFGKYRYKQVDWLTAASEIMDIRRKVFVIEQRFDKEVICDMYDHDCCHILVSTEDGEFVGCGRLVADGRVGKIAVLINHRGNGIGTNILSSLINIAKNRHIENLVLNAEKELTPFYDQQEFHADGPVYMKSGVPYQRMSKRLA